MKKSLLSIAALAITGVVSAQVSDISITGAPTANYTWWDNNTAIEDGVMYGGQLGFGFGRGLELRAIYEKSADLKSTISEVTNDQNIIDKFKSRKVDVTRWGGEFKGNIPTNGWLAPYFTLGSGVQTLKVDNQKQEQIYATAGLGTKFNISDRVTFNVEGKAFAFNMDPSNVLYERKTGSQVDNWVNNNISEKQMINWSVMAGLQFYLGGKDPRQMTALERAYDREFGGGLRGFKFVVEPGIAYVDFDKKLNLRDSYFIGGSAGFDITEFVGIRGFYYQASKNEKITTDWDKASFYGGDFLARLNVARGVVPYITVGGGYMNVYDSYKGKDGVNGAKSGYFAKGGGGVTVPLSTFIEAYGSANLLLTTDNEDYVNGLKSPDQIRKNIMYTAGLRLKLGAKADASDELQNYVDREADKRIESKNKRIAELEKELEEAYKNNDTEKAVKVIKEKQQIEETYKAKEEEGSKVRMSPKELQDLVKEVIEDVETKQNQKNSTEDRIDRLERLLLEVNTNRAPVTQPMSAAQTASSDNKDINQQILEELKKLNAKNNNAAQGSTVVVTGGNTPATSVVSGSGTSTTVQSVAQPQQPTAVVDENGNVAQARSVFFYKGVSAFAGVNFGGATTGMFGLKAHYGFTNSNIEFAPDLMFGLGKTTIYGVNANILFPFNFEKGVIVKPYAGIGLGLNNFDNDFSFGSNLIIGTSFNVLNGQLYVDYTTRNLFDNNQIAVGYRFGF